jgi:cytosine deaminase
MILANARLPQGGLADVEIAGGVIAALHAPGSADQANERIDLKGALLLPAFVDGHIHLDKTHWGAPRLPHVEGRSVRERITAERVERHRVALPIEARASALIRTLIANGTTRVRSHIDIDNDVGLANLEAVLRVREAYRGWIDIQLVAFPQSGVTTEKGAPELMAAAMSAGADLIGGLDPAGFDGDVKGQLDIVFALAGRFGKGIDIHLHDGGETGASELRDIAERTIATGMQGRVAVSHAFALGSIARDLFAKTADALARAEVAIMT